MNLSEITLSAEQRHAVSLITTWHELSGNQEFRLGGYAGTGKTTVIRSIVKEFQKLRKNVAVVAFTGKAVDVLQKKGLAAETIHSLIYDTNVHLNGSVEFKLKLSLKPKPDLIICDEASMVSTELHQALKSFRIKLLFVGDPGQLEPVGDNPNLMREPDYVLETIHRQAATSPIITLANAVRLGCSIHPQESPDLIVRKRVGLMIPDIAEASQVICAKNKTRTAVNKGFRAHLQRPLTEVQEGDKLIILRNNSSFGVFNGMLVFVDSVKEGKATEYWKVTVTDEVGHVYRNLPLWKEPFLRELPKDFIIPKAKSVDGGRPLPCVYADFGYCITCHKSQGSEWDHVVVLDEWMHPNTWDMKRWRYTAITRAAKKLSYYL